MKRYKAFAARPDTCALLPEKPVCVCPARTFIRRCGLSRLIVFRACCTVVPCGVDGWLAYALVTRACALEC